MVDSNDVTPEELTKCMSEFRTIKMKNIHYELEEAVKQGKYAIVVDKNDKCATYYTYQATMVDFTKEVLKAKITK